MSEMKLSQRLRLLQDQNRDGLTDDGGYVHGGFFIRPEMLGAIRGYVEHGYIVGGFLTAVLENDLSRAVTRADAQNLRNLPAYVMYLNSHVPASCWGSKEKVAAWIKKHADDRERLYGSRDHIEEVNL